MKKNETMSKGRETPKRLTAREARQERALLARADSAELAAVYDAVIPRHPGRYMAKFATDQWGNRVRVR